MKRKLLLLKCVFLAIYMLTSCQEDSQIGEPYLTSFEERIDLYNTILEANRKIYNCSVFLYHIDREDEKSLVGQCAVELSSESGEILDRKNIYSNNGISGVTFYKDTLDDNFTVFKLENDVLAFLTPDAKFNHNEKPRLIDAVFFTVNKNEELVPIIRNYNDDEYAEKTKYNQHLTIAELRFFKITDNYEINQNSITFNFTEDILLTFDGEKVNINDKLSVTVEFDFEKYELNCLDDNYRSVVFYQ